MAADLLQRYREELKNNDFQEDPAQLEVLNLLQQVADELLQARPRQRASWWRRQQYASTFVTGAYLWGGVGRGKTWLMDLFYSAIPETGRQRYHFHRFMYRVHKSLHELKDRQRPLDIVAEQFADQGRLLCLDEFFVTDITDAMLLHGLLQGLFDRGVTLVTTSNIAPDDLYRNGLQRSRFLPAIDLLKKHTHVLKMAAGKDYRLRYLAGKNLYLTPLDNETEKQMRQAFVRISPEAGRRTDSLEIAGRMVPVINRAEGVLWSDFAALCEGPRSSSDYLEITRAFHTVLISGIPRLTAQMEEQARRFINMVDVFYDYRTKLMLSAAVDLPLLYDGRKLAFEFQRTESRLREMQSQEYLARLPVNKSEG